MPDEETGIDADAAVEAVEPLAERAPIPRWTSAERVERHAFDAGHHLHDVVDIVVTERRDGEPAVAAHHRRDAVQW